MVNLSGKGVNWVQNINNYRRVLNEQAREELGWKSPFEIYYGRGSNFVRNLSGGLFLRDDQSNAVQGLDKMMKKRFERIKNLRKI